VPRFFLVPHHPVPTTQRLPRQHGPHHPTSYARRRHFPRCQRPGLHGSTPQSRVEVTAGRLPPGGGEQGAGGRRTAYRPFHPPAEPLPNHGTAVHHHFAPPDLTAEPRQQSMVRNPRAPPEPMSRAETALHGAHSLRTPRIHAPVLPRLCPRVRPLLRPRPRWGQATGLAWHPGKAVEPRTLSRA
jgi:hypothetical protein